MSKELLQQVGKFLHGEQWQAPLARDISVGERSMRRWAAGTDQIPNGVWRDIGFRLESVQGDLEHLLGEVMQAVGLIEVHSFEVFDSCTGDMVRQPVKSTAARIVRVGGSIILGSAEWVLPSAVDAEGRMLQQSPATTQKQQKTATELAAMITARIGDSVRVGVHKDPVYGWHPTVFGHMPATVRRCQSLAEQIARELRADYDLKIT